MHITNATQQRFFPIFIFCVKSLNDMLLKIALTSLAMLAQGFKWRKTLWSQKIMPYRPLQEDCQELIISECISLDNYIDALWG